MGGKDLEDNLDGAKWLAAQGAGRAAAATLGTLFERLSGGQARDLAERLSFDVAHGETIIPDRHPEQFGHAKFACSTEENGRGCGAA